MNDLSSLAGVKDHDFVDKVLREAVQAQKQLGPKHPVRVDPGYTRDPDEYEFYLIRVGKCLADLLTCCEHLDHIPAYIANYRETTAMKRVGLSRHEYIVLHVEGYLMRVGGFQDRCLKLIDAVFHLLNNPRNITSRVVLKNIKVERTDVPATMKKISALVEKYAAIRNAVVHHQAYSDDQLRMLEMYHLIRRNDEVSRGKARENIAEIIRELTFEVIREKRSEFVAFNDKLGAALPSFLAALEPVYHTEAARLKAYVGE
jgi:hypothetical protein